ncbi:MAG: DEAD/DEAH box helicase, partial [bacterium]
LLHDYTDVQFASDEFEKLWQESVEVLPQAVTAIVKESYLRDDLTPFELYIKFLIEFFGPAIEYDPNAESDLPKDIKRLAYQSDAVTDGWLKLQKHGGFFLADVVGLGKTIVAARIAKKFFFHNGFPSHRSRILIIAPPALRDNWEETLDQFGLDDCAKVLNNGSLHKVRDPEKYDLVIVDEAHRFRNDTAGAYDLLQKLCKTPTKRRLPDGSFAPKKVILVSATPLNNRPADIRNLVLLFQDGKDSTVIGNLQHFFAQRIKEYAAAKKIEEQREAKQAVAGIYESIREKVVQPLTVRRTRTDLLKDHRYKADLDTQGIRFPRVEKPRPIFYRLDSKLEALYDRTIGLLASPNGDGLTYNRYRAIAYLRPDLKARYQNADLISAQLAHIMKTLLVKRIDSSFRAFTISLRNFRNANEAMRRMFARGAIYIAPNLNVSDYILEDREADLIAAIEIASETDPTIQICKPGDFLDGFSDGLEHDATILEDLVAEWEAVKTDPKLDEFLVRLAGELRDPKLNETGKLVIFSEARDTTEYLAEELNSRGYGPVLTVDSHTRKARMPVVRANFDANMPLAERKDDFHILLSTEVLAEGVNLHRSHVIVNYDTPWNSTRLMQRIGRVNRIGSTAKAIHIFNFYPTAQVDLDIDLKRKAFLKLQAFHTALGEDSQIYSPEEDVNSFGLFDKEIEEERDERLAFLSELRDFKEHDPNEFRRIRSLPFRARCGRQSPAAAGHSLAFIRNDRRDAFYGINGEIEEMSFVEMARAFRAEPPERPVPLHDAHHNHVLVAVDDFESKLQADAVRERAVDHTLGPNEQKAIRLLAAACSMPNVSAEERKLFVAAQQAVKLARFQDLPRKINAMQRAVAKTPVTMAIYLDKLAAIVGSYPLITDEPTVRLCEQLELPVSFIPDIILSESFSASAKGDTGLHLRAISAALMTRSVAPQIAPASNVDFLGCLEGKIKFGPGWQDPLPSNDWEALR